MATVENRAPQPDYHRLVDHLKRSWTDQMDDQMVIDPVLYSDPEAARLERERVFAKAPVAIAHSTELPEKGSFITRRLPNNEVLVVRQPEGEALAFVNACRHRGSMIENQETGVCSRRLQCPYHGWSYNLDGSLRSATHEVSFGEFDHVNQGLIRLPVEERHGFIWVVDSVDAEIDVASWLGEETDAIMASYGLEDYVCVKTGTFDEPVNWKVLQDAFLDGYHISFVHKETAAKIIYTNILAFEDFGRHTRFMSPRKTIEPLLERDTQDLTPEELKPHVTITHGLFPNATLLNLPDHFELLSFVPHPKDPAMSRMEMRLIVPRVEDTDWTQERWDKVWGRNWQILMDVLKGEDFPIARDTQNAMESADAGPMIIGRNEVANQAFHRELARMVSENGHA